MRYRLFCGRSEILYDLPPCSIAVSTTMPLNDNFVYAPPQDPLSILFEDEDLIVVDKPVVVGHGSVTRTS